MNLTDPYILSVWQSLIATTCTTTNCTVLCAILEALAMLVLVWVLESRWTAFKTYSQDKQLLILAFGFLMCAVVHGPSFLKVEYQWLMFVMLPLWLLCFVAVTSMCMAFDHFMKKLDAVKFAKRSLLAWLLTFGRFIHRNLKISSNEFLVFNGLFCAFFLGLIVGYCYKPESSEAVLPTHDDKHGQRLHSHPKNRGFLHFLREVALSVWGDVCETSFTLKEIVWSSRSNDDKDM